MKQKSVTIVMVDNDRLYIDPTASTEYEGKCSELQLSTFYFKIFNLIYVLYNIKNIAVQFFSVLW